ncbi:MAG: DUF2169 domain-containing protein [Deltaproteobacteria bacterium]|nr:DUF2169 domain-containing protein [Deltaproteobacteria bacterium]
MDLPEIDNRSAFAVLPLLLLDREGEHLLIVIKGTFGERRPGELAVATTQRPVRVVDEPWGDPVTTPPKYPSDLGGARPGADVALVASAHTPGGRPTSAIDVAVRVGTLAKELRVHGPRVWLDAGEGVGAARPIAEAELRYDAAWGGLDASAPEDVREEPRNPVGRGVVRERQRLTHTLAPTIEDPRAPIDSASRAHVPAGVGPIGPHWEPRRSLAGTMDARWLREQAPLLPRDRDPRASSWASPGLHAAAGFVGGEEIALLNVTPGGGLLRSVLPVCTVRLETVLGARREHLQPSLDGVVLDTLSPEDGSALTAELVWRAVLPVPRRLADLGVVVRAEVL